MREGGLAFPDTFWLSPRALRTGGCSATEVREAREAFTEELAMAGEEADEELLSDEGEEEDEAAPSEGGVGGDLVTEAEVEAAHVQGADG